MQVWGFDDTFSWFIPDRAGSHDLKFGAQYQLGEHLRHDQRYMNGSFEFAGDMDFDAANPSTYPERLSIRLPAAARLLTRTHSIGLYGQDKWQVTPNLTLSLGLRYDLHISPIRNTWNPFFEDPNDYPIDEDNIQPRAGFAYNMGGRAVIRGGYGMFYEKQWIDRFENFLLMAVYADSFIAQYPINGVDPGPENGQMPTHPLLVNGPVLNRDALNRLVPPGSLSRNTGTVVLDTPGRVLPVQHQASIGYERQIGQQLSFGVDYVHISNRQQPISFNLNPNLRASTSRTAALTRVDFSGLADRMGLLPFTSGVTISEFIGESEYDGVTVQLEKRFSSYWSGRVSYALAHGRGNTGSAAFQVLDERHMVWGPNSRRHVLSLSGRIDTPWVTGLSTSAIMRLMSGTPFTLTDSSTDPDRNGSFQEPLPPGTYSGTGPNAMTVEYDGGVGGAIGPDFAQLDLRVSYRLRPAGRTVDFYGEVFNVTNRANFNNPTGDRRSGNFLVPTALRGGGFPRQIQFGARLGF
jgi:hypothetical protein